MKNALLTLLFVVVAWVSFNFGKQQFQKPKIVFPLAIETTTSTLPVVTTVTTKVLIGGDKDSHGCLASAGYTWCQIKNKCLRTWEEACKISTTTTTKPPIVGGDKDAHGCLVSAGYSWCELKNKCLRTWEEPCVDDPNCKLENCHGLDIKCGPNAPQMCTMEYAMGDRCLQYAKCGILNGKCQQLLNSQFTECKTCIEKCIANGDTNGSNMFVCESLCK